MRTRALLAFAAAGTVLAACGGGGSSISPIPTATTAPSKHTSAQATFVVKIPPKRSTANRTAKYITADVQGIEIDATQNGDPVGSVFYALDSQQSYCTTPSGGGLTCTLQVAAKPGDDTFAVTTFDHPEEYVSNVISVGSVETTISAQTGNTVTIVTSGVPTFFSMTVDNAFPAAGTASTEPVHFVALDADANVIIGPYDVPISLASNDTSGTTQLSATSVSSSSDANNLTVSYTGATPTVPVMFTATSNSPMANNWNGTDPGYLHYWPGHDGVLSSPSSLLFSNASAAPQSITLTGTSASITAPFIANTGMDWYGDYGLSDTIPWTFPEGCQGIVTVSGSSPTFTVTPVQTGFCYLNVRDSASNFGVVPIVVQSN